MGASCYAERARADRAVAYQACVRAQLGQPTEVVTSASKA
jgi:hypothetical protein